MAYTKPKRKQIYRLAWSKWGKEKQVGMLIEECAELIKVCNKLIRFDFKRNNDYRELAQEIADVEIMTEQMKFILDWMDINRLVEINKYDKLMRLEKVVNEDKQVQEDNNEI